MGPLGHLGLLHLAPAGYTALAGRGSLSLESEWTGPSILSPEALSSLSALCGSQILPKRMDQKTEMQKTNSSFMRKGSDPILRGNI